MQTSLYALLSSEKHPSAPNATKPDNTLDNLKHHVIALPGCEDYDSIIRAYLHRIYKNDPDIIKNTHQDLKIVISNREGPFATANAWYYEQNKTLFLPLDTIHATSAASLELTLRHEMRHDSQYKTGKMQPFFTTPMGLTDFILAAQMMEAETAANDMEFIRVSDNQLSFDPDELDSFYIYNQVFDAQCKKIKAIPANQSLTPDEIAQQAIKPTQREYMKGLIISGINQNWRHNYNNQAQRLASVSLSMDIQEDNVVDFYTIENDATFPAHLAEKYGEYGFTANDMQAMHQAISDNKLDTPIATALTMAQRAKIDNGATPIDDIFRKNYALSKAFEEITYNPQQSNKATTHTTLRFLEDMRMNSAFNREYDITSLIKKKTHPLYDPTLHSHTDTTLEQLQANIETSTSHQAHQAKLADALAQIDKKHPLLIPSTDDTLYFQISPLPETHYNAGFSGKSGNIAVAESAFQGDDMSLQIDVHKNLVKNAQDKAGKYHINGTMNEIMFNDIIRHAQAQSLHFNFLLENNIIPDDTDREHGAFLTHVNTLADPSIPDNKVMEKATSRLFTYYVENPDKIENGDYGINKPLDILYHQDTITPMPNPDFIKHMAKMYNMDEKALQNMYTQFNNSDMQKDVATLDLFATIQKNKNIDIKTKPIFEGCPTDEIQKAVNIHNFASAMVDLHPNQAKDPATRALFFHQIAAALPQKPAPDNTQIKTMPKTASTLTHSATPVAIPENTTQITGTIDKKER